MKRYCLDTSGYSHFKRGHAHVVDLVRGAEWIGLPAIVLGELFAGFLKGSRRSTNERELLDFLAHPVVHELPVNHEVAMAYAEIYDSLRRAGTPLPANDIWIAATAASTGATILTFDGHFRAISRVASLVL